MFDHGIAQAAAKARTIGRPVFAQFDALGTLRRIVATMPGHTLGFLFQVSPDGTRTRIV